MCRRNEGERVGRATAERHVRRRKRASIWIVTVAAGATLTILAFSEGMVLGAVMFTGALSALLLQHNRMKDEGGVAVIVYHSVSQEPDWLPEARALSVSPQRFARQIALVKRYCAPISNAEFLSRRLAGTAFPAKPVVIHLDDGYLDNWVAAFPILRAHQVPATIFVSLDFIDPREVVRPRIDDVENGRGKGRTELQWEGYLNWPEIVAMHASGLVDVQAHGIDHGRVETGPRIVDTLTKENWRRFAWVQWRHMSGNKSHWFLQASPAHVPLGAPIRENGPSLANRAWLGTRLETEAEYENRVRSDLARSRKVIAAKLHREISVFCWPENAATAKARRIAREVGFVATTAGNGENRPHDSPEIIGRVHVGETALAGYAAWADDLYFRATIRTFQGNYYWYIVLVCLAVAKRAAESRLADILRRRDRDDDWTARGKPARKPRPGYTH